MLSKKTLTVGFLIISSIFLNASFVVHFPGNTIQKIVIDAGHGGKDPGTCGGREKQYALDIALLLGKKIKANLKDV